MTPSDISTDTAPKGKTQAVLLLAFRLFLGGLFVYASLHKLSDPVAFSRIIYGYRILPPWAVNIGAITLPGIELVAGLFLLAGFLTRGSSLVVSLSLLVFVLAIGFNLARGLDFDCGCFSFARSGPGAALDLLIRDIVLLGMSLKVTLSPGHIFSLDGLIGRNRLSG